MSKPGSVSELIGNDNYSVNLHTLYETILFISLICLPFFATIFVSITYFECTEKPHQQDVGSQSISISDPGSSIRSNSDQGYSVRSNSSTRSNSSSRSNSESLNLKYLMSGVVVICIPANIAMIYFQVRSLSVGRYEWSYNYSFYILWLSIIVYLYPAKSIIAKVKMDNTRNRLTSIGPKKEGVLLWIVNMTVQLVSWHLVFVVCGFILNPLRAFLYSMLMIVTIVCLVIFVAIIIKLIYSCKRNEVSNDFANALVNKYDIAVIFSMIMLLLCAFAYIVFIFQISITINNQTVEDILKSIIPNLFLMMIIWLLPKVYLDPNTILKYVRKNEFEV